MKDEVGVANIASESYRLHS